MTAPDDLDRRPPRPLAFVSSALAVVLISALAACGTGEGTGESVAVPGVAAPYEQFAPGATAWVDADAEAITPIARVDDVLADTSPANAAGTDATMPVTTVPVTTVPVTTAATTTPSLRVLVPAPVVVPISGWPAFDLQLQTVLAAGSDAVSATVLRDGEVVHEVALGRRTPAGDPVRIGDRYRVASISKVITSITILRLVQAGLIDLDAPVGERLAQRVGVAPSPGVAEITPRHLLTHRSGIGQYEDLMFRRQVESCDQAAATGLGRTLERAPGTTFRYSNLNFCLLGLLVEDVTGRPYADVVQDELLTPLGITDMRQAGTFDVRDGDVEHRSDDGRNYMEVLGAAGSWIATPTDIATIIDSLDPTTDGWKPLYPDVLAQMQTITIDPPIDPPVVPDPNVPLDSTTTTTTLVPPPRPTTGYGMGLMIFGPDTFGHTGTLESTHAMSIRRADGYTWAITVSGDHPASTRDLAGIMGVALRYAGIPGN